MISNTAKLAIAKRWGATLVVGPNTYKLTELPSRTLGQDQARGTCTMTISDFPDELAGAAAYVNISLNGESERYFSGKVDVRPISDNPPQYQITLIDTLGRLDKKIGKEIRWSNTGWAAAVRALLNSAGVSNDNISDIYDPGVNFKLGANYSIIIEVGETVEALLKELMDFAGAGVTTDPDGKVRVVDYPGWPATDSDIVYAYGADKISGEFGITGSNRTLGGSEDRVNSFKAKGPRRPDRSIPDATFTITNFDGKYEEQEYKYCQTNACAAAIAEREIVRRNRQSTEVEVNAPLNPSLRAGDSIQFRNSVLGFATNTPALILAVSNSAHTMTVRLSVGAKPADGSLTFVPPPTPNFTMMYEQQPIKVAGISAVRVLVDVKDTSHDATGFHITSWKWTAVCASSVEPASSEEQNPQFIFATLDGAKITLEIESTSGEGAIRTKNVAPATGEVFTRCLSIATPDGWYVLAGAAGWRHYGSDCTAVPGINDQGPLIAGFSDGSIYKTEDFLFTEPPQLATLEGGAVRCMFVNEANPTDMLAGVGASLFRSGDGGVTWALLHTFPDDINYCESAPANAAEIRVCAGRSEYFTTDGSSFTVALTGPLGSTCRKVASAPWGHLVIWSGTSTFADAYKFEESGKSLNTSGIAAEHLPIDLASVTPLQYEEGYLLVTGAANDVVRDGLYQQLAYVATGGESTPIYKALSAGDGSFTVEYRGTGINSGANKIVNHKDAYLIAEPEVAYRIGYGQPTETPEPPEIILLPFQQGGGADRLAHYKPLTGWEFKTLPIAGADWIGLAINTVAPAQWIIWTYEQSRVFYTGNMGLTWIEIYLPPTGILKGHHVWGVVFIGDGAKWVLSASYVSAFGAGRSTGAYYARGDGPVNQFARTYGDSIVPPKTPASSGTQRQVFNLVLGADKQVFGGGHNDSVSFPSFDVNVAFEKQYWIDSTSLIVTEVGDEIFQFHDSRASDPLHGLGAWNSNVGQTPNYRTTAASPVISGGSSVVETVTGVFTGDREGIAQIANFDTSPEVVIVAGAGVNVGKIVRGRYRRGMAARALTATNNSDNTSTLYHIFAFNGLQWVVVDTPEGINYSQSAMGIVEL